MPARAIDPYDERARVSLQDITAPISPDDHAALTNIYRLAERHLQEKAEADGSAALFTTDLQLAANWIDAVGDSLRNAYSNLAPDDPDREKYAEAVSSWSSDYLAGDADDLKGVDLTTLRRPARDQPDIVAPANS